MTGRLEEELKIEKKIKYIIEDQPEIVKKYYNTSLYHIAEKKYIYKKA